MYVRVTNIPCEAYTTCHESRGTRGAWHVPSSPTGEHGGSEQLVTAVPGALDATLGTAARVALVAPRAALLRARVAVRLDIPGGGAMGIVCEVCLRQGSLYKCIGTTYSYVKL